MDIMATRSEIISRKRDIKIFILGFIIAFIWFQISLKQGNGGICLITRDTTKQQLLFVAVLTTRKYLNTRAKAIFETWGKEIPGHLMFFVGGSEPYNGNLPVVTLTHVNDSMYPPQIKSFAMMKYIATHFVNDYEWFMRADDDLYVKTAHLEMFLRTINSSKRLFIGQPGLGLPSEMGKLGLASNSPYCMGGPGVILTKQTLLGIKDHIGECLQRTVSLHEDTELGRCIQLYTGLPCTIAEEFDHMFLHRLGTDFHKNTKMIDERSITLHPVKQHIHMYQWKLHFLNKILNEFRRKLLNVKDKLLKSENLLEGVIELQEESEFMGSGDDTSGIQKYEERTDFEIENMRWELLDYRDVLKAISSKKAWKTIWYNTYMIGWFFLPFTYQRLSHGTKIENIIIKRNAISKNTHSITTKQLMYDLEFQESKSTKASTIYIILPVYKRVDRFISFIAMVSNAVKRFKGTIHIRVVLYADKVGEYKKIQLHLNEIKTSFKVDIIFEHGEFSRGSAMNTGTKNLPSSVLMLFIDVDMIFDEYFLNRVVLNTIQHAQVYFPIVFSQFNPKVICIKNTNCNITVHHLDNQYGFWRHYGFGMLSIYKSDYLVIGGYNINIKGWGLEDIYICDKCISHSLKILRAVDPSLVHVYHDKVCSSSLTFYQYGMCISSRNTNLGREQSLLFLLNKLNVHI